MTTDHIWDSQEALRSLALTLAGTLIELENMYPNCQIALDTLEIWRQELKVDNVDFRPLGTFAKVYILFVLVHHYTVTFLANDQT